MSAHAVYECDLHTLPVFGILFPYNSSTTADIQSIIRFHWPFFVIKITVLG